MCLNFLCTLHICIFKLYMILNVLTTNNFVDLYSNHIETDPTDPILVFGFNFFFPYSVHNMNLDSCMVDLDLCGHHTSSLVLLTRHNLIGFAITGSCCAVCSVSKK